MSQFELPDSWAFTTISEVAIKGDQRAPDQDETFTYVDIGSIDRVLKRISDPQILMGKNAPSRARKAIRNGDVLVSLTRPNLNAVALVTSEFDGQIASTGFEVIRPCLVDSRYIFGLTRSKEFIDSISGAVQGALYPAAKSSDVQGFKFPLPPLAEQKIIADKLDTLLTQVESIKARLERIPEILKQLRQSVLAAAVSGKLTEEWEGYDWQDMTIGEIAKVRTGKTPSRTEEKYWENGVIPWLTSSVTGSEYCFKADEFISELASKECNLKPFPVGTLLLAMYGEGKTRGQVTELKLEATCNQACAAIIPNNEIALTSFVKLKLQENYEAIRLAASGGNQPNLNLNKVREINIQVPTLEVQIKIVQEVEKLLTISEEVNQQVRSALDRVNNLTQSILAKAFRGELTAEWREANPELISGENSAKALLERIKAERASVKPATKRGRGKA
ncbi:TPA: restriction endonuclease subunit S [Acinetobacter baumannii]